MPPRSHDPIKAKQKRQKRIAIGGAALLLILLVLEGPKVLKQMHGGSSTTPAWLSASRAQAASGAPVAVSPAPVAPAAGGAVVTPVTGAVPSGGSTVLISDQPPTAGVGHLSSFGTFASKDPFAAQVKIADGSSTPPAVGGGSGATQGAKAGSSTTPSASSVPSGGSSSAGSGSSAAPAVTSAVIAVNGVLGSVDVGTDFPAPSTAVPTPLFHLVSLTAHTAKIAIVGGSYASGAPTITLLQGKTLTLENTADGTRYTLKLYPQGTAIPTTQAPTTTAPATKKQDAPTAPIVTTPLIPTTALTP